MGISHQPSAADRQFVLEYAGYGVPQDAIAAILKISVKTLRKYYREELDLGEAKANAAVAGKLFEQAMKGNIAAQIFWLKARAGWRETQVIEHKNQTKVNVNALEELSDEELAQLESIRAKLEEADDKSEDLEKDELQNRLAAD